MQLMGYSISVVCSCAGLSSDAIQLGRDLSMSLGRSPGWSAGPANSAMTCDLWLKENKVFQTCLHGKIDHFLTIVVRTRTRTWTATNVAIAAVALAVAAAMAIVVVIISAIVVRWGWAIATSLCTIWIVTAVGNTTLKGELQMEFRKMMLTAMDGPCRHPEWECGHAGLSSSRRECGDHPPLCRNRHPWPHEHLLDSHSK